MHHFAIATPFPAGIDNSVAAFALPAMPGLRSCPPSHDNSTTSGRRPPDSLGPNGVQYYVAAQFQKIVVSICQDRLVAPAK